jgi:hypothetical protein
LDLTVNPDFGQVEADPSQVNLTAFRLFFQERRPFFIEGTNTLNFPITDFNSNNLFYSRRIGRTPQGEVETDPEDEDDGIEEYVKSSTNSTILGAAKITGKNKKGFSWGVLESVTALEKARVDSVGTTHHQTTEPLTNYFVMRAQQDVNKGNTVLGAMLTATHRDINDKKLEWLHRQAYTGGVDLLHHWKDRTYFISAKTIFSQVNGSQESITNTQRMPERYFQRSDNKYASVDSTRTSLAGTGGTFVFGKKSGKLVYDAGYTWLSPALELNDIGFLSQTDQLTQWVWAQYRILSPIGIFRTMRYNVVQYLNWDFDRRNTSEGYELFGFAEFKNFFSINMGGTYEAFSISNADLRGGPALRYPGNASYWFAASTDKRKKFHVLLNPQWRWGVGGYMRSSTYKAELNYRPTNALSLSFVPSLAVNKNDLQYVATVTKDDKDRYVVAEIDQVTVILEMRMTYMITPNLSIQYWGQPFGTTGTYSDYKFITQANAPEYSQRFTSLPSNWLLKNKDDEYDVDENLDGSIDYTFDKPNFNIGQFRSNLVVRWEYIPGSTVFLVWTQQMEGEFNNINNVGRPDERYKFRFNEQAHNVFLLKFTYRFIR